MTRLAILSDIHGNLPALEAVIDDMQPFEIDQVVVAGDTVSGAPFSVEVMERVLQERWAIIRGNHEFYLLDYNTPRQPAHWNTYTLPPYLEKQLKGRWHNIIAALPDTLSLQYRDAPPVRVVHASPRSHWDTIYPADSDEEIIPKLTGVTEATIIFGHCHLQLDRQVADWRLINPGSVGLPLDGIRQASYMILDGDEAGWQPTFRRVDFDLAPVFEAYEQQDFVGQCGIFAHLLIEELKTARPQIIPFYTWHQAHYPGQPRTLDQFEAFLASGQFWDYVPASYLVNMKMVSS